MQEYNKASLPRAAAVCPSDPSVPTGPSLASSLTMADIEVVIQQVLSRTSTALFVALGKQTKLPFNKSDSFSSAPFDLIHSVFLSRFIFLTWYQS